MFGGLAEIQNEAQRHAAQSQQGDHRLLQKEMNQHKCRGSEKKCGREGISPCLNTADIGTETAAQDKNSQHGQKQAAQKGKLRVKQDGFKTRAENHDDHQKKLQEKSDDRRAGFRSARKKA